jgi:DNA polymerase elongation subunit (family B)
MIERLFTLDEIYAAATVPGAALVFDCETFPNYFLASFMHVTSRKICFFELHDYGEPFQHDWIRWILHNFCIVGFNSRKYDLPILSMALDVPGITCAELKAASNELINGKWGEEVAKECNFNIARCNHIDLIEVAPLQASLKMYGARLHCKTIQDLPYHHEQHLTREEKNHVRNYNFNDLDNTCLLLEALNDQLNLRAALSAEYGQDLRSKSDAQIAEAVIGVEIKRITGKAVSKPKIAPDWFCKYKVPAYLSYVTPELQNMLEVVRNATFRTNENGVVMMPTELEGASVRLGSGRYRMGIGGLHSSEQRQVVKADEYTLILDRDVASYYPSIIITLKLSPAHLGEPFLQVYKVIIDRRLTAKQLKDFITSECLKIVGNGAFGKLGSPYSILYSPDLMVQVTLTGQLALLMQIEMVENMAIGCRAVSANTDGATYIVPKALREKFNEVMVAWEKITGFVTEETEYKAVYSRDVNNYIAVKSNGKAKAKGAYSNPWDDADKQIFRLFKNPHTMIAIDAATVAITKGIDVADTIRACGQMERFVSVTKVNGGAQKDGRYLGKTVRWYYAKGILGTINYVTNNNRVSRTDGAKPCMVMPDVIPDDLDYDWYIEEATCILEDVGYLTKRHEQFQLLA